MTMERPLSAQGIESGAPPARTAAGTRQSQRAMRASVVDLVRRARFFSHARSAGPHPEERSTTYQNSESFDTMYVVAHPDDSLLFQSPTLLRDVQNQRRVVTVHVTAGDAGLDDDYWRERESGIEAAYAMMAGVENHWHTSTLLIGDRELALDVLLPRPSQVVIFLRLPDGGFPHGLGTRSRKYQSLTQLWDERQSVLRTVDSASSYARSELVDTLSQIMEAFRPGRIATHDYTGSLSDGDHPDHHATALFTNAAHQRFGVPHTLVGFVGYPIERRPANVVGPALVGKQRAFYRYSTFDRLACSSARECSGTPYESWLEREYVSSELNTITDSSWLNDATDGASGLATPEAGDE